MLINSKGRLDDVTVVKLPEWGMPMDIFAKFSVVVELWNSSDL